MDGDAPIPTTTVTLRVYVATQAMAALIRVGDNRPPWELAVSAYDYAEAVLNEDHRRQTLAADSKK